MAPSDALRRVQEGAKRRNQAGPVVLAGCTQWVYFSLLHPARYPVKDEGKDRSVLEHIQHLVAEEHRLFEDKDPDPDKSKRLATVQVELDQCWDLLRQRRALRETGGDPSQAHVRPPEVIKKYIA
jgi:hypothetical protein